MNKVIFKLYHDETKAKNNNNWSFNTDLLICKKEPHDVNNFSKSFTHILNFQFYRPYYILKIFLFSYSINAWLHFANNNLHRTISWSTHLFNPHAKPGFCSNKPHFYCVPPKNILDKFTLIKKRCRFHQPGLVSYDSWKQTKSF